MVALAHHASCNQRGGIYVITLDSCAHAIVIPKETDTYPEKATTAAFPGLAVCQAVYFDNPTALYSLTCLQMTSTSLFVTWKPHVPRLSEMLLSPGHRQSEDALQQPLLVDDEDQWHIATHNGDHVDTLEPADLPGGKSSDQCVLSYSVDIYLKVR
jgi:hypothetical protein